MTGPLVRFFLIFLPLGDWCPGYCLLNVCLGVKMNFSPDPKEEILVPLSDVTEIFLMNTFLLFCTGVSPGAVCLSDPGLLILLIL